MDYSRQKKKLDQFLKKYFYFTSIEEEAQEFLLLLQEDSWEDAISFALSFKKDSLRNDLGIYEIYLTILLYDHLYQQYGELVPKYDFWHPCIAKKSIEISSCHELLTESQKEFLINFFSSHIFQLQIPVKEKYLYLSPLSRLGEAIEIMCEKIAGNLKRSDSYVVYRIITLQSLIHAVSSLKRKQ